MKIAKGNSMSFPELRGKLSQIRYPAYVEPKWDGELNWYFPAKQPWEENVLINKSGKVRTDMPITNELKNIKYPLLGELYWSEGKAGDLYEFLKHQKDNELKFMVFDVDIVGTFVQRRTWLERHIKPTQHTSLIPQAIVTGLIAIKAMYKVYTDMDYEGIVIKNTDSRLIMGPCGWVKMKKREEETVAVYSIDPTLERVSFLWCGKEVGLKVPNNIKSTLKEGDIIEIEHMGVLKTGGLRHPVYKGRANGK